MGGRRRCCCKQGCDIVHDDFNRTDSTTVGSPWTEESGDWEIDSNTLTETTGTGIIRTTTTHPMNHWSGIYGVTFLNLQYGNKYRLLFNVVNALNYYYVELYYYFDDPNNMVRLSAGMVEDGVETELKSLTQAGPEPGYDEEMYLCRDYSGIYYISTLIGQWGCCGFPDNSGRRAGLANNSGSNTIAFDDYTWDEHFITDENCPRCYCSCEGYCIPDELTMTVEADCGLDGLETTGYGSALGEGTWQFDFNDWLYLYSGGSMVTQQKFKFWCPCFGNVIGENFADEECEEGANFFLCDITSAQLPDMPGWTHNCYSSGLTGAYATAHTCNPLWWQFGPFEIREYNESPEGYEVLCTFKIHVTE